MGFIDSGTLLAQDNPERLILKYNCLSLEDVFLELCLHKNGQSIVNNQTIEEEPEEEQEKNDNEINNNSNVDTNEMKSSSKKKSKLSLRKSVPMPEKKLSLKNNAPSVLSTANFSLAPSAKSSAAFRHARPPARKSKGDSRDLLVTRGKPSRDHLNLNRLTALLTKNYVLFKRNPVSIILLNILPIFQIALYCVSFERNPQHIPIAVVNRDNRSSSLSNVSNCLTTKNVLSIISFAALSPKSRRHCKSGAVQVSGQSNSINTQGGHMACGRVSTQLFAQFSTQVYKTRKN